MGYMVPVQDVKVGEQLRWYLHVRHRGWAHDVGETGLVWRWGSLPAVTWLVTTSMSMNVMSKDCSSEGAVLALISSLCSVQWRSVMNLGARMWCWIGAQCSRIVCLSSFSCGGGRHLTLRGEIWACWWCTLYVLMSVVELDCGCVWQ